MSPAPQDRIRGILDTALHELPEEYRALLQQVFLEEASRNNLQRYMAVEEPAQDNGRRFWPITSNQEPEGSPMIKLEFRVDLSRDEHVYTLRISSSALTRISLDPFERAEVDDCLKPGREIHEMLMALEIVCRRYYEHQQELLAAQATPTVSPSAIPSPFGDAAQQEIDIARDRVERILRARGLSSRIRQRETDYLINLQIEINRNTESGYWPRQQSLLQRRNDYVANLEATYRSINARQEAPLGASSFYGMPPEQLLEEALRTNNIAAHATQEERGRLLVLLLSRRAAESTQDENARATSERLFSELINRIRWRASEAHGG